MIAEVLIKGVLVLFSYTTRTDLTAQITAARES